MIKILCYNIHGGYDHKGYRDLAPLNALMDQYNIDVAVLREFETRPSRGATLDDIHIMAGEDRLYHLPGLALVEGEG